MARTPRRSGTVRARITTDDRARSAVAAAALGAAALGLVGLDGGVLWVLAGVWTARVVSGSPIGLAWGVACLAGTMRWGTLTLGDVAVATRLAGPSALSGTAPMRAAMAAAILGAVLDEARVNGLRAGSRAEQAAAVVALVALVGVFLAGGPQEPFFEAAGGWAASAALVAALTLLAGRFATRVPAWFPVVLASGGLIAGALSS